MDGPWSHTATRATRGRSTRSRSTRGSPKRSRWSGSATSSARDRRISTRSGCSRSIGGLGTSLADSTATGSRTGRERWPPSSGRWSSTRRTRSRRASSSALGRSRPEPDLRPERREHPVGERLDQVRGGVDHAVREEPLAVVVEPPDLDEAGLAQQPLQPSRAVAELGRPVGVARVAALEALLPVRLGQQQPAAGLERAPGRREDELGPAAVVERVVDQARIEAAAEVELLVVAGLEASLDAFARGLGARDLDHLGRDVVPLGVDPVARGEAGHPAGATAELDEARAGVQVEQLQDVAEVDQEAGGLARVVAERLGADPLAARVADRDWVLDLGLLALLVGGHAPMIGRVLSSNSLLLGTTWPQRTRLGNGTPGAKPGRA